MPDDINPITPPTITPTEPLATPVAEPAVDEAQSVLDSVVTEVVPDEKPVEDKKTVETAPTITEHPISDEQAKQFAGMGDFSLPQSPLDNLDSVFGKTEPEKKEDEVEEKPIEGQPITPMVVSEIKPEVVTQEEVKTEAVKPDLTPPPPAAPSATLAPEDLEKKAAGMLKELDAAGGSSKPKKRKSGSTVKMALAAVLVVLMGAGGLVGMNLLKMQQVADQRSQAGGTGGAGCASGYTCEAWNGHPEACTYDSNRQSACHDCVRDPAYPDVCTAEYKPEICGYSVEGCNAVRCHCCSGDWVVSSGATCDGVCDGYGGEYKDDGSNCNSADIDKCSCSAWTDGCGTGCVFPSGIQQIVDDMGKPSNCATKYVAMCAVSGFAEGSGGRADNVFFEEYKPGQACYGKLEQCNNPVSTCTSTPSPSPSPSPTDEPLVYSCTGLTKNVAAPAMGSAVVFTCTKGGTSVVNHYEFRYRIGTGANIALAAGTGNQSTPLTINALGDYTVECRVCKSTDATDCTVWGAAGK